MKSVSIAEAKARLSELIEHVAGGDTVQITKRGRAVAEIKAVTTPRKPIDVAALRALRDSMPKQKEPASRFIRRMRDDSRY
jgi:antitoxin (DNA-binding transcriptional repressor) of toxin-antitoxin stability system